MSKPPEEVPAQSVSISTKAAATGLCQLPGATMPGRSPFSFAGGGKAVGSVPWIVLRKTSHESE